MPDTELAWAAGFFDGEGCTHFGRYADGHQRRFQLTISQTDPEPLERFRAAVGVGRISGPYDPRGANWKPFWKYQATGKFARIALEQLKPWFCTPKRQQAELALQAYETALGTCIAGHPQGKPDAIGRVRCVKCLAASVSASWAGRRVG